MGRFFICWVCLWFCFGWEVFARKLPYKGIYLPAKEVEKGDFKISLDRPFSEKQISKIELSLNRCQAEVRSKLEQYNIKLNELNTQKAHLQEFSDIPVILENIKALEKQKKEIKKKLI